VVGGAAHRHAERRVRALLQRVSRAAVRVEGQTVAEIGTGLLVLLGVERDDQETDATALADKSAELRIFADLSGRMNRSVEEAAGALLVVSQFTLVADTRRGRRPSFAGAAPPERADALYRAYCERLERRGLVVRRGVFGAMMEVELVNDGPVTLWLDPAARAERR
jgi:D-tyrosyl-tRNA(Tyr) deacylase